MHEFLHAVKPPKRRKIDDGMFLYFVNIIDFLIVSPSTTSTVESVTSCIEVSSICRYTAFKDWIETKLFVQKISGMVSGIIQAKLYYSDDLDGWPKSINCTVCKRGDTV